MALGQLSMPRSYRKRIQRPHARLDKNPFCFTVNIAHEMELITNECWWPYIKQTRIQATWDTQKRLQIEENNAPHHYIHINKFARAERASLERGISSDLVLERHWHRSIDCWRQRIQSIYSVLTRVHSHPTPIYFLQTHTGASRCSQYHESHGFHSICLPMVHAKKTLCNASNGLEGIGCQD